MPLRSLLLAATAAAAFAAMSAPAFAAPPLNDDYLQSTALNEPKGPLARVSTDSVDTTDATIQSDLFNPGPQGQPLGGDGPENTRCHDTTFGKTVWWDFHPPVDGGVEIKTAGFDAVVSVYQWDDNTAKIVRTVGCQDTTGITEDLILPSEVKRGRAYTVQVGGVAGPGGVIAGGPLSFELDYFRDTDGDGIFDDEPDGCRTTPGPGGAFGGCPPQLNVAPIIKFNPTGDGIKITQLLVGHLPKGAKVRAKCGGCRTVSLTAKHTTVELKALEGRSVRKGSKVQIQVTLGRHGRGKFRYGATGALIAWPVKVGGIGIKRTQCLHVKTNKIQKCH